MPLSTSSSNPAPARRGIVALLIILAVSYGLVEWVAWFGFSHISSIQRRINSEYMETLKIRPVENGKPSVLLCGNSLLLEGVNLPGLQDRLDKGYSIHRFVIESTEYLDWYFGLQRLFREGMRPSCVMVMLTTNQLVRDSTRGEYFAYFLMSPRDILQVKKKAHLDTTTASNYFAAAYSPWLGAQSDIRKWILHRVLSHFTDMTDALHPPYPEIPPDSQIWSIVPDRLAALQKICQTYGSRLVIVVPPSSTGVKAELIQQCGRSKGVTVLVPFRTLPPSDFRDGFHLNSVGNALFTEKLARDVGLGVMK
jgi:hypothetical protein